MRRVAFLVVVAVGALAFATRAAGARPQVREGAAPRPEPVGTAVISGTLVVDDSSSRPIRKATISLNGATGTSGRVAVTDDSGRFQFANLPAGRFTLSANRVGYVRTYYGSRRPSRGPGTSIVLADGQRLNVDLRMPKGAVVTGTVTDSFGHPLPGSGVEALVYTATSGPQGSVYLAGLGTTDDRGIYRIFGLPPGSYRLMAISGGEGSLTGADPHATSAAEVQWAEEQLASSRISGGSLGAPPPYGRGVAYSPVYFPGTANPAAAGTVDLAPGEERTANFAFTYVQTTRVTGTTVMPDGQPAKGARLNVVQKDSGALPDASLALLSGILNFVRIAAPDGSFQIGGLPPGEYSIVARSAPTPAAPGATPDPPLWGEAHVVAGSGDQTGLEIRLQPGVTVTGSIVFDATSHQAPAAGVVRAVLSSPPTDIAGALSAPTGVYMKPDGTFAITGVAPGRYVAQIYVSGTTVGPWTIRSAVIGGRDIVDTPLEVEQGKDLSGLVITMTDRVTSVSGTLLNGAGKGVPDYAIVAFPTNRTLWTRGSRRIKGAPTATNGSFLITGLPAGEYYLAAVTDYDQFELFDAAFLGDLVASARTITLADGESKVQDFRISGG